MRNILFWTYLLLFCVTCKHQEKTPDKPLSDVDKDTLILPIVDTVQEEVRKFYVQNEDIRLHEKPDTKARVIRTLKTGSLLEYQDTTSRVNEDGEEWYKVKTADGQIGWASAGEVGEIPENVLSNVGKDVDKNKVLEYELFLSGLSLNEARSVNKAVLRYRNAFKKSSPATCDAAYLKFAVFYRSILLKLNGSKELEKLNSNVGTLELKPKQLQNFNTFTKSLSENGLYVGEEEGAYVVEAQPDFCSKTFQEQVSLPMKLYLQQVHREELDTAAMSPKKLMERTLFWDNLSVKYPDFLLHKVAEQNYKRGIQLLLSDISPERPMFDENRNLKPEYKTTYQSILSKHAKTRTASNIEVVFAVLEAKSFTRDDEVDKVTIEVLSKLEEEKENVKPQ